MTGWRKRQIMQAQREDDMKEDIVKMAREATVVIEPDDPDYRHEHFDKFLFACLVIAAEREACAKVCEDIDTEYEGEDVLATWCASAIRARSNT